MPKKRRKAPATLSTLDEVELQLTRIRSVLAADDAVVDLKLKMTPNVRVKLSAEHRQFLKLKADIENKAAVTEDKIAQHPKFIELRNKIVAALADFPDAAKAVLDALDGATV